MEILAALKQEQAKLQHQLKGIETAITALNGSSNGSRHLATRPRSVNEGLRSKRTMSAASRAKISKATKARWAKYRAEKARKSKQSPIPKN